MPKYAVPLKTGAWTVVYVEAEDAEQAAELVWEQDLPYVCAQCAGWGTRGNTGLEINDWEIDNYDEITEVED